MRKDLAHLKWQLINIKHLSPEEADMHIKQVLIWEKEGHRIFKANGKKLHPETTVSFQEGFKQLLTRKSRRTS